MPADSLTLIGQLQALLMEQGPVSLMAAAQALQLQPRTLERRLRAAGLRFEALVDDHRRRQACALLRQPQLDVADIALRLGYRNTSNFSRTCRRWFGATPSELRLGRAPWPPECGGQR